MKLLDVISENTQQSDEKKIAVAKQILKAFRKGTFEMERPDIFNKSPEHMWVVKYELIKDINDFRYRYNKIGDYVDIDGFMDRPNKRVFEYQITDKKTGNSVDPNRGLNQNYCNEMVFNHLKPIYKNFNIRIDTHS